MKLAVRVSFLGLVISLAATIVGCGGGGTSTPPPPISVSVSAASSLVDAGTTTTITAQLTNDTSNQGVAWTMLPAPETGSGALINATGTSVTYKAPATPPANSVTVTITATAVADGTKSGLVIITLNSVSVSASATNPTVGAGGTDLISATVSGDSSNRGVTWTISPTTGAGTLSNATTTSVTYNAPPTPPANDVPVTITATSVADTSKSNPVSITFAAIAVSVTATPGSVEATGTAAVSATVNYDPSGQGVTWSISPTTGAGTLSNPTSTSVTYTAPPTPPASDLGVTITATSISDTTKSGSAGITVLAIAVTVTPASALIPINASLQYTGTVNNDPTNNGASWAVTQNGTACSPAGACGTVSLTTTPPGTPTTYTAPATAPASRGVTLTATSVEDKTKSANTAITVSTGTVEVVPYGLNFGTVKTRFGGSRILTITLTNTGGTALSISSITITGGPFTQTNTCGKSVGSGLSCTITVTFKPTFIGTFHDNLVITDSSSDSPQQVALTGVGANRFVAGLAVRSALTRHRNVTAPTPTGGNKVGTRVMKLVDATREDPYLADGNKRELMVRFWYPASLAQGCQAAEYTSAGVWSYFSELKGVALPHVATNSCWNAPMASGPHPVVVFTHGYTGTFTDYTFLFEDLASRGYVVASVDHTYEATAVEFPDGRMVKSVLGSYLAKGAKMDEQTVTFAVLVRLGDLKFVVDELERLNAGSNNPFAGKLDMSRVALVGHSVGGLTALLGVEEEPRFRAGVTLDGVLPDFVPVGTQTPMLVLTAGNDGWGESDCRLWNGLSGPRMAVNLKGAEHVTPSDAVWLAKYAIKTGSMGPQKTIAAVRSYIAAFLDANLKGQPAAGRLKGLSREYPDVVVTTQSQSPCGQP